MYSWILSAKISGCWRSGSQPLHPQRIDWVEHKEQLSSVEIIKQRDQGTSVEGEFRTLSLELSMYARSKTNIRHSVICKSTWCIPGKIRKEIMWLQVKWVGATWVSEGCAPVSFYIFCMHAKYVRVCEWSESQEGVCDVKPRQALLWSKFRLLSGGNG